VRSAPEFRIRRQSNSLSPLQHGVGEPVDLVERGDGGMEEQAVEPEVAVGTYGVTRVAAR
jgi:hypothetical protein